MQQVIISITAQDNHFMNAFDSHFSASLGTLALFNPFTWKFAQLTMSLKSCNAQFLDEDKLLQEMIIKTLLPLQIHVTMSCIISIISF